MISLVQRFYDSMCGAIRLATVVNADRILVLKKGRIIETGTHRVLTAQDGYYAPSSTAKPEASSRREARRFALSGATTCGILARMLDLPEWDSQFVARAKRHTRRMNLYSVGGTLIVFAVSGGLALATRIGLLSEEWTFRSILLFFGILSVVFLVERILRDPKFRRKRRLVYRSAESLPGLALLCLAAVYWWLVFPGHVALAIGAWWVGGIAFAFIRHAVRRWALREAVLLTNDYKLFAHRTGKFSKRVKHDRASLYLLAEKSAFPGDTVMTLIGDRPRVYIGVEAQRLLGPDELRVCVAHELGHSWSQHYVGYELTDWIRRLFFVPVMVSAGSVLLVGATPWLDRYLVFAFLAMITLVWEMNVWASRLLGRPREVAADLYAVEVTSTPQAFAAGLAKLAESSRYNVLPNLFDTVGFASHPCVVKRLRRIADAVEARDERPRHKESRRR